MIREPIRCEDEGYIGADSISRRVSGPTLVPGLIYTSLMFFLSPQNTAIGFQNTSGFEAPVRRAVQTAEYMYAMYYGDRATAEHAAKVVNAIHDQVNGTWPPTGDVVHRASDPSNLLWLLIPYGQGVLDAYDAYGPRRLTAEERDRYWREESAAVGRLNRIPDDALPKSQDEADAYLESQRPLLATGEGMAHVIENFFPSVLFGGGVVPPVAALPLRLTIASGVALLPDYAMRLMGQRPYSRAEKLAIRLTNRPVYAALTATPVVRDAIPLAISGRCRTVVRRGQAAARTGQYDPPVAGAEDAKVAVTA